MQQLTGRVAVVTGAASGIGFGLAERFVAEGMRLVLADVEERALSQAADRLSSSDRQSTSAAESRLGAKHGKGEHQVRR